MFLLQFRFGIPDSTRYISKIKFEIALHLFEAHSSFLSFFFPLAFLYGEKTNWINFFSSQKCKKCRKVTQDQRMKWIKKFVFPFSLKALFGQQMQILGISFVCKSSMALKYHTILKIAICKSNVFMWCCTE